MQFLVLCWDGMTFQEFAFPEEALAYAERLVERGYDEDAIEFVFENRDDGVWTFEKFREEWG